MLALPHVLETILSTYTCADCGSIGPLLRAQWRLRCDPCKEKWRRGTDHRRVNADPCAESGCAGFSRVRGLCRKHYNRACRRSEDQQRLSDTPEWRRARRSANWERERTREHDKEHRRRAAKYGSGEYEAVDRQVVGDRDGWRCFCGRKVDPKLVYPHPMSQSLDHIDPLSDGGAHTYANTRIAHVKCNSARGNRGGGEQLALIG